jgi:tetratricopeptide (TPR) repeat protein
VLAIDPTHEQTLYHLATAYARTNQHDKVQSAIDRLAQVNPAAAFEVQGNYSASQGEYEKAIEYYDMALKADSTWVNAPNMKSYAYQRMGQFKNALETAQQYLAQNPVGYAYYRVARCYLLGGDFEAAKRTIESGLPHFPDSRLQVNLGEVSALRGEYDLAEAQLRVTVSPDQPDRVRSLGLERLATFYLYQGKYSAMTRMFDERIKMALADQDNSSAAESIAKKAYWMYLGWRDKDRVYKELESAAQLSDVFSEEYFTWLAGTYAFMGDFKQAEKAYRQIAHQIRKLIIESHILLQKQEWDRAIAINNLLINKWDASGQTLYGYFNAICYYEQGKLDKAVEEVTKAANFYSWDHSYVYPQSFLLLGKIYEKKDDKQRAIESYEKFLDLWKDADEDLPDLIEAKQRLTKLKGE